MAHLAEVTDYLRKRRSDGFPVDIHLGEFAYLRGSLRSVRWIYLAYPYQFAHIGYNTSRK